MTDRSYQFEQMVDATVRMPEEQHEVRYQRRGMAIIAAVIVANTAVIQTAMPERTETMYLSAEEQAAADPEGVRQAFEQALSNDTCKTKVSAKQVADVYSQIFGPSSVTNLTTPEDPDLFEKAVARLGDARRKLTFANLPYNDVKQLEARRPLPDTGPSFERDMKLLDAALARYDMTAVYGVNLGDNRHGLDLDISLLTLNQLNQNKEAREAIMATVINTMQQPRELMEASGFGRLVFGDLPDDDNPRMILAGQTKLGGEDVYIDITNGAQPGQKTLLHEDAHLIDAKMCGKGKDLAYMALNGTKFRYGDDIFTTLEVTDTAFTTLEGADEDRKAKAIVARSYGARNNKEDIATLLGEEILTGWLDPKIYKGENKEVLKKKVALLVARLIEYHPSLGNFYLETLRKNKVLCDQEGWAKK